MNPIESEKILSVISFAENFNLMLKKSKNLTFRSKQGLAKSKLGAIPSN